MKKTLKNLFYSLLLYPFFSFPNEQWMSARSIQELEQMIEKQENKEKLKALCLLQLQKETVPYACYEWISFSENPRNQKNIFLISYLNEKCEEFSLKLTDPEQIKQILQKPHLSKFCRKQISQVKKLIEYQLRDQAPKNILNWHLQDIP